MHEFSFARCFLLPWKHMAINGKPLKQCGLEMSHYWGQRVWILVYAGHTCIIHMIRAKLILHCSATMMSLTMACGCHLKPICPKDTNRIFHSFTKKFKILILPTKHQGSSTMFPSRRDVTILGPYWITQTRCIPKTWPSFLKRRPANTSTFTSWWDPWGGLWKFLLKCCFGCFSTYKSLLM